MAITFNHSTQRIVTTASTVAIAIQDLVNAIRAEEASERGITYPHIADATGKDNLGGGVAVGITCSLLDPWQLEPYAGNYTLTIDGGNLVSLRSDNDVTYYVVGGPQIEITRAAAGVISTVTSGSGLSTAEHDALMTTIPADLATIDAKVVKASKLIPA